MKRVWSLVSLSGVFIVLAAGGCESVSPEDPEDGPLVLAFVTQPAGASGGTPFTTQPVVEVLDATGNRAVGTPATITVELRSNPGGGSLSGTATVTAANGLASFTDLRIDKAGTGYTLTAKFGGSTAVSQAFDVAVGPPNPDSSLVTTGTGPVMAGDTMLVTVTARDAGGNALTAGGAGLQISLDSGTTTGTFGPMQDLGTGTYTSVFTATGFGTPASVRIKFTDGEFGAPRASIAVMGFVQISISNFHACAVANTGDAYCWGGGSFGELGSGAGQIGTRLKPTKVAGGISWIHVGAGANMTCGLAISGQVYCWGTKINFSTGISGPSNGAFPEAIDGSYPYRRLAVGWDLGACGITTTNLPICWGVNAYGQVGTGSASPGAVPSVVAGAPMFAAIARDIFSGCGVTPEGKVYCWGGNLTGLLGVADNTLTQTCGGQKCSPIPMAVPGAEGMVPASLSIGQNHACALKPDGAAYCWGNGGSNNGQASPAVPVPTLLRFTQFVTGSTLFCGIATDTRTYCWGDSSSGQTGTGSFGGLVTEPTRIAGNIKLEQIDAGIGQMCGIAANGRAYCWGWNSEGQLGDGTTVDRAVPTLVQSVR
jgi:alpha-tubulin suppressor-like RCC1 family protein